jgi:SAM-dependent methyltransferase
MSGASPFVYSGHENLLAMQHAVKYNRFLAAEIEKSANDRGVVLDFGAGVGALAKDAKRWSGRLVCIEPDRGQREILAAQSFEALADLSHVPDESVDYVYCVNVLEHIEDDAGTLRDFHRKIRRGGRLFLYVPAMQFLYSAMDRAVGHHRRYYRGPLNSMIRAAGFGIRRSDYVDFLGVAATLVYKCVGDREGRIDVRSLRLYDRYVFPLSRVFDAMLSKLAGKNLLLVAEKP